MKPLVSISVITYNQEQYIIETLDSIVSQKANFAFEIVVGDDCSTDKTREICLRYKNKYPDLIRLRLPERNLGSITNWTENIKACQGKYIALCEGDDYWTDPYKLQKQVDFLENNADHAMVGHAAQTLRDGVFEDCVLDCTSLTTEDILLQDWGLMTASLMFRKDAFIIPDWYYKIKNGDFGLQLLVSLNGKIGYLKDIMCVYRLHAGGISNTLQPFAQGAWLTYLLYEFNNYTEGKYRMQIKQRIKRMFKVQIGFAQQYHLRRAEVKLRFYQVLNPFAPFLIRNKRK